jgi:glutamine amidotransferase/cyclase
MSGVRIGIVDYDAGNITSLAGAMDELGLSWRRVGSAEELASLGAEPGAFLVLPGVGAFGAAMDSLDAKGLSGPLRAWLEADRPFLGICLGLQLLYQGSQESPGRAGLGVLPGICARFSNGLKVPAMGWNLVRPEPGCQDLFPKGEGGWFYFDHSFHPPLESPWVAARTDYGFEYPCAVRRGRACAFQFHPEKSSRAGLALLRRILLP